jgi:hypothetical protein
MTGASCRDVVAGASNDLVADLCETLAACNGACPPSVEAFQTEREGQLDDDRWTELLKYDTRIDCASTCSSARKCLDYAPFCADPGTGCDANEDCCRSSVGLALCEGADGGAGSGACCLAPGAQCDVAADDACCEGSPCAANGRCGGVECTLTREDVGDDASACASSFECCSHRCEAGHCVAFTCASLGQQCKVDTDCCSQPNEDGALIQPRCDASLGLCVDPTDDKCDVCVPVDDSKLNCCLGQMDEPFCYVLDDGTSRCGPSDCAPIGAGCSGNADCCDGYCDTAGSPHCAPPLTTCSLVGGPCDIDGDCCSGQCSAGLCSATENCAPKECHPACQLGGPLDPLDASCEVDAMCLATVCAAQPACCCQEWGPSCRLKFQQVCGPCM